MSVDQVVGIGSPMNVILAYALQFCRSGLLLAAGTEGIFVACETIHASRSVTFN